MKDQAVLYLDFLTWLITHKWFNLEFPSFLGLSLYLGQESRYILDWHGIEN